MTGFHLLETHAEFTSWEGEVHSKTLTLVGRDATECIPPNALPTICSCSRCDQLDPQAPSAPGPYLSYIHFQGRVPITAIQSIEIPIHRQ
jgi:hypothetical protein